MVNDETLLDLASLGDQPDRLVKKRHDLQQQERELICQNYAVLLAEGRHLVELGAHIESLRNDLEKAATVAKHLTSRHQAEPKDNLIQLSDVVACLPAIASILSTPKKVQRLIEEDNLNEAFSLAINVRRSSQGKRVASKLDPLIATITDKLFRRLATSNLEETVSIVKTLRASDEFPDLRYAFLKIRRRHVLGLEQDLLGYIFDTVAQYKAIFGQESDYLLRSWLINVVQNCTWSESLDQTLAKLGVNVSPCFLQKRIDQLVLPPVLPEDDLARIKETFEDIKSFCPLSMHDEVRQHFACFNENEKAKAYVDSCMNKLFPRDKLQKYLLLPQPN